MSLTAAMGSDQNSGPHTIKRLNDYALLKLSPACSLSRTLYVAESCLATLRSQMVNSKLTSGTLKEPRMLLQRSQGEWHSRQIKLTQRFHVEYHISEHILDILSYTHHHCYKWDITAVPFECGA